MDNVLTRKMRGRLCMASITCFLAVVLCIVSVWLWSVDLGRATLWKVIAAVAFYSCAVLMIGWLLFVFSRPFRSQVFRVVVFGGLFVWGCVSYYCWPVDRDGDEKVDRGPALQIEAANRVFACFFSGSNLESVPLNGSRLNYELFHFALIFYLGAWAFSLWGVGFVNMCRRWVTNEERLCVVWGVNEQGLLLARSIVEGDARQQVEFKIPVKVFETDEEKFVLRQLSDIDCFWTAVDFDHVDAGCLKGAAHYFLSDSGLENVRLASALARLLPKNPGEDLKTFHVRIESSAEEQAFYDCADSVKDRVDVVVVRESEMIARRLVRDFPLLGTCPGISVDSGRPARVVGSVRLLLIGFGSVGWDVLEHMIGNSRFSRADGSEVPFSCVVVDKDKSAWDEFCEYCPEAVSAYNLKFEQKDVSDPKFPLWVAERLPAFNRVVLTLSGDELNMGTLCRIQRAATTLRVMAHDDWRRQPDVPRIFVKIRDAAMNACLEHVRKERGENDHFGRCVRYFGRLKDIYTPQFLNFDRLYEIACVLNAYYETQTWLDWRNDGQKIRGLWRKATWESRWSSLASAAGEWNALTLLGFRVERMADGQDATDGKKMCESCVAELIDVLGRNEHFRWNAWHRLHGYRRWDMDNPPIEEEAEKKANKLKAFRCHAAIVDYDDLPAVDARIARVLCPSEAAALDSNVFVDDGVYRLGGRDYSCNQKKDRDFCRAIPENMQRAGFCIRKATDHVA